MRTHTNKLAALVAMGTLLAATAAHAGSVDYLSNQSGQFIGDFSKNAKTDSADIASYNPAGTAWLSGKLYFNLGTQTVFKEFGIRYQGERYVADNPTPIIPSFYVIGKPIDDLAIFGHFNIIAGGGTLEYGDGVPFFFPLKLLAAPAIPGAAGGGVDVYTRKWATGSFFNGSSVYYSGTIGAAYRILNYVSVSASARLVYSDRTFEGQVTYTHEGESATYALSADKTALGFSGIFGVHVRPIPELDIAFRFETETALNFKTSSNLRHEEACQTAGQTGCNPLATSGPVTSFTDGFEEQRNLPMVLGVGVAAHPIPELTLSLSFNYYFVNEADTAADETEGRAYVKGLDDDYDNGFDIAFSASYKLIPEVELTLGYNHTESGGNADTWNDFEYALDSHSVGLQVKGTVHPQVDLVLGLSTTLYNDGTNVNVNESWAAFASFPLPGFAEAGFDEPETFSRWVFAIGFGIEWRPDI